MNASFSHIHDDEVAAALAAVECLLAEEAVQMSVEQPSAQLSWRKAALLEAQGLAAERGARTEWGQPSRAARARRWSRGIVGS